MAEIELTFWRLWCGPMEKSWHAPTKNEDQKLRLGFIVLFTEGMAVLKPNPFLNPLKLCLARICKGLGGPWR